MQTIATLNNKMHSFVRISTLYFAIIVFGETIGGVLGGLMLSQTDFFNYEWFTMIDLPVIIVSMIVSRGIGASVCDLEEQDAEKYRSNCAKGLRISLITGIVLAVLSAFASCFLFYDAKSGFIVEGVTLSCVLFEPLVAFCFPLLFMLRELCFIKGKLRLSIASAVVYILVYLVSIFVLAKLGLKSDTMILAHLIAEISIIFMIALFCRSSNITLKTSKDNSGTVKKHLWLSGLPAGIGYGLYSIVVYLFSQVSIVEQKSEVIQVSSIIHGSLSFGIQNISGICGMIIMASTMLVLVFNGSLFKKETTYDAKISIKRLIIHSSIIWFAVGILIFIAAPIFTDAVRITAENEINITLIGFRICSLTLWIHNVVWILIQYYVINHNHKKWLVLLGTLFAGYILMLLFIFLLPDNITGAWLLFALTPVFSLITLCLCRKRVPKGSNNGMQSESSQSIPLTAKIKSSLPNAKHLIFTVIASMLFVTGLLASNLTYYEINMLPDISNEKLFNFENRSHVIANDGKTILSDIYFPRHETIKTLDEVSPYIVQAVIAREDCRFYRHNGVDIKGIGRATIMTLTSPKIQGGSTITMQLMKNSVLANTGQLRTVGRKISEIILALRMEQCYDKDTILTMYLNNVNFGNGYYGIKSASKHYFRKDPKDLTLAEAVSLSTLIQRPNDMRMASNDEFALKARERTLASMVRNGYISETEKNQAAAETLNWNPFEIIINHSKISSALTKDPLVTDNTAYLSVEDVSRYLDTSLYLGVKEGVIATFGVGGAAEFDFNEKTLSVNGESKPYLLQFFDNSYYIPVSELEDLYGIDVFWDDDTLLITSRNRKIISATVTSDVTVNYLNSDKSFGVGKIKKGDKVYVQDTKGNKYRGWSRIRTEGNVVGYVKTASLTGYTIEKEAVAAAELFQPDEPFRITWDLEITYDNASRIISDANGAYNTIMPLCYKVENGKVIDQSGVVCEDYIRMFNNAGFHLFPSFSYVAITDDEMNEMSDLLSSYYSRKELIRQILHYVDLNNLKGINMDFEHMYKRDAPNFTQFIRELKAQLESRGCLLFVDVITPDGDDNWSGCYEHWKLGMTTDYMICMAYDYTSKASDVSGSGAPYYWVKSSLEKLINRESVSSDKLIFSLPLYMRVWDIDEKTGKSIDSKDFGIASTENNIPKDAKKIWLKKEKQHYVEFKGNDNIKKQAWLEDTDSLSAKMQLISEYQLPGVAFWVERYSDAEINSLLSKELEKAFDK